MYEGQDASLSTGFRSTCDAAAAGDGAGGGGRGGRPHQ